VTFFVTSFPKIVTFWSRWYKKNLNGKKCDDSAGTETCFLLFPSQICHLSWKREAGRPTLRVNEIEANEQHNSIIEAFKAAAPEWTFEQINFVAERRSAVVEDDFYNKLEQLNLHAGKMDKILLSHVQRISEAHDTVMRSYYQQIYGSSRADATRSMDNIEEQVYV